MALKCFFAVTALFCFFGDSANPPAPLSDPRVYYTMVEIVCGAGYYIQEYNVDTDDGYILTVHRIPNGKRHPKIPPTRNHYQHVHEGYHPDFAECVRDSRQQKATGPPVLLAHGLLGSSDFWVLQGPNYDLAFMLVDKGYDVWFSNARGNFYSRRHKTLRPTQAKFWDFSFHENGLYDIPSTIDYILGSTNYQRLNYIGHSMGTTMLFVMASLKPEYNDKVQVFVGLAPVSQIRRQSYDPPKQVVLLTVMSLAKAYNRTGTYEFLPRTNLPNLLFKTLCAQGSLLQDLCYDAIFAIFGYSSKQVLRKSLSMCLSHSLSGISVKTFLHYDQLLDKPFFMSYDCGPDENLRRYGQPEPQEYVLRNVKIPTALFYSADDFISRIRDVAHLKSFLPNVIVDQECSKYNHMDFVWAYSAKDKIFHKILQILDQFTTNQSEREGRFDSLA